MAKRERLIKKIKKQINEDFEECPINKRKGLFIGLEEWGKGIENDEARDIFLTALYDAENTQDTQILLAVDKAVDKLQQGGK